MIYQFRVGWFVELCLILAGGAYLMAQTTEQIDPKFVTALQTNVSGIYFSQIEKYQAPEIERQFRAAAREAPLLQDKEFMANLFYLVRMKQVMSLKDEVWRVIAFPKLPPLARVSGLKTAYALGTLADRLEVDRLEAQALMEVTHSDKSPDESPYLLAADRIGGTETLLALQHLLSDAANHQEAVTQQQPDNFSLISRLDKIRDRLQRQVTDLRRKTEILGRPEPKRTLELTRVYMSRPAFLTCWAYRELLAEASPQSREIARDVVTRLLPTFLPSGGQVPEVRSQEELDLRLRGILLLEKIGTTLSPDQIRLITENQSIITSREPFFRPDCSWEKVLDVI